MKTVTGFTIETLLDMGLVQGAGHTVPEYKPREALEFFSHWLEGKKI